MTELSEFCEGTRVYHIPVTGIETAEVLIEYCENCKQEVVFTKSKHGRIDNELYRVFHAKDMMQPNNPRFEHEYEA